MGKSYITKNSQGPVTVKNIIFIHKQSYITKNSQGPVTSVCVNVGDKVSYITKNSQGPVTLVVELKKYFSHTLLKIHRVL